MYVGNVTIGAYIRNRRLERGLTIKGLRNKTKISPMELWRIEQDRRKNWNLKFQKHKNFKST